MSRFRFLLFSKHNPIKTWILEAKQLDRYYTKMYQYALKLQLKREYKLLQVRAFRSSL